VIYKSYVNLAESLVVPSRGTARGVVVVEARLEREQETGVFKFVVGSVEPGVLQAV